MANEPRPNSPEARRAERERLKEQYKQDLKAAKAMREEARRSQDLGRLASAMEQVNQAADMGDTEDWIRRLNEETAQHEARVALATDSPEAALQRFKEAEQAEHEEEVRTPDERAAEDTETPPERTLGAEAPATSATDDSNSTPPATRTLGPDEA